MYIFYFIIFISCIELIYITFTLLKHLLKHKYDVKEKCFMAIAIPIFKIYFKLEYFFKYNNKTNITLYVLIPLITFLLFSFVYINIDNFKLVFNLDEEMKKNIFANVLTMIFEITVIYFLLKKINEKSFISTSKELFNLLYEDLIGTIAFLENSTPKKAIHQLIKKRHLKNHIKSLKDYTSFLYLSSFYSFDKGSSLSKDILEYLIIRHELLNNLQSCVYHPIHIRTCKIEKILNSTVKLICDIDSKYKFGTHDTIQNRNTKSDIFLVFNYKEIAHNFHLTAKILDKKSHIKINGFNVIPDIIKKHSDITNYDEHAKML